MECRKSKNIVKCNCTYGPCTRKGLCCECIAYHKASSELPACFFPNDIEKTFDRSFERFAQLVQERRI